MGKLFYKFRKYINLSDTSNIVNLTEWRDRFLNAVYLITAILILLLLPFSIPALVSNAHFGLIALDIFILFILLTKVITQKGSNSFWMILWLLLVFLMTVTFFITLGPHYARSAWLVFLAVMAALFFGSRAGIIVTLVNISMLIGLYLFLGPENEIWKSVYEDPLSQYVMFVANVSILTLLSSVFTGYMLSSLGKSLNFQQKTLNTLEEKNKQILESEAKFSKIFHTIPESISITTVETGNFIEINMVFEKIYGYKKEELKNKTALDLGMWKDPEDRKRMRELLKKEGSIRNFKTVGIKKSGESFFENLSAELIQVDGEDCILTIVEDITEKQKLQETLIQSVKMLSLGGLAAGMAHEINNPLAGIMQNAQVITNRLGKDTPANIKAAEDLGLDLTVMRKFLSERKIFNQLDRIREAGTRAAEIVSNMLGFARKEHIKSTHNICELLDRTVEMAGSDYSLKKKYDFRSIKIVRRYEENLPMISCDPGQIQQVFFNLLKNGAEAMSAHSILEQAQHEENSETQEDLQGEAEFTLEVRQNGKKIRVEIENNLCGISAEVQKRIFEPFYTTKPVGIGTGLGLSVSYFIIHETHKGNLSVESNEESWVKFIIELPFK